MALMFAIQGRRHDWSCTKPPPEARGIFALPRASVESTLYGLLLVLTLGGSPARAEATANEPLAEVNGEVITAENLDRALGAKLSQIQEQLYAIKRAELDAQIAQRLLAQEATKRGVSVAALLDAEMTAKVSLVTETEIEAVFQENKSRLQELMRPPPGEDSSIPPAAETGGATEAIRPRASGAGNCAGSPSATSGRARASINRWGADSWDSGCSSDARGVFGFPLSVLQAGATDADPGA